MNIIKKGKGKLATLLALIATVLCAFIAALVVGGNSTQASAETIGDSTQTAKAVALTVHSQENGDSEETNWNKAITYSQENDGAQVTFVLDDDWTATADPDYGTSFGDDDVGFTSGRICVFDGANIVLDLGSHNIIRGTATTGAIAVADNGILEIRGTTGKITGSDTTDNGGGVCSWGGGTLILTSGAITGNKSAKNGGGVWITYSTFIMNGGTIDNNTATSLGGGVFVSYNCTFTMNGGTISDNAATGSYGSGVFVQVGSVFTMENGTITGNTSSSEGAVTISSAFFTMNDGIISNNTVRANGAGLTVLYSSVCEMNGGIIDSNIAPGTAGGLYLYGNVQFTMNGGTISNNISHGRGGGVRVANGATLTMNGGEISNNTTTDRGGGVYVYGSTFVMNKGSITDNTADTDGGGVGIDLSTFTMNGGTISDNFSQTVGGGLISYASTAATINGGTFSGNKCAGNGSAIRIAYSGTVVMNGGTITGNKSMVAGTVSVASGAFTMTGGEITNNLVTSDGGGVSVGVSQTMNISGTAKIYGNSKVDDVDTPTTYTNSNVRLPNNMKMTVTGMLAGANIGVEMQTNGIFTSGYSSYNSGISPALFFSSDAGNDVILSSNEAAIGTGTAATAGSKGALTWQYQVSGASTWSSTQASSVDIPYDGSTYAVQVYKETGTLLTIAKASYKDANGNSVMSITNAGTYSFVVNDIGYTNYSFTINIKPLELTVDWDDNDIYYSGSMQTPSFTLLLNGDPLSDTNVTAVLNTSKVGTNAGSNYTVSIAELYGSSAVNYKFKTGTKTTVTYSILKATPEVNPVVDLSGKLFVNGTTPTALPTISTTADGTIAWVETELVAGTNAYNWTFTPTDTTNYNTVTGTYVLTAEEVAPASISATFNAGENAIYTGTTFGQLKSYMTVTCTNNDGTNSPVTDYDLFGTLTVGTSTLTITYSGLSTTVDIPNVLGVGEVTLSNLKAEFTTGAQKDYFAYDKFNPAGVIVTAVYSDNSEKIVANYTFEYMDPTKDYLCANDAYITFKYLEDGQNVSCRLSGITVLKAKPTVNPVITIDKPLIAGEALPAVALSSGDTDGNIGWTVGTLVEGTKTYTWTFTPTGTEAPNYATATGTYIFTAEKKALKSIAVTYAPAEGFEVTEATSLSAIKNYVSVEATYNDGDKGDINNFELFGTLREGKSTLTVTYGGASTTFDINNVGAAPVKVVSLEIKQKALGSSIYTETDISDIKKMITVTATYSNGDTEQLEDEDYDLYTMLIEGPQKLVVEYEGVTNSIDITVQAVGSVLPVQVWWLEAEYVYDGKQHIPTPYIRRSGEMIMLETKPVDGYDGISAGIQKVEAVASDKYQLLGETVRTYTIEKAEISILWSSDDSWTYNGEAQNPAAQVKAGFNDGKISVQYKVTAKSGSSLTNGKAVNAGAYVAEVVLGGAENYTVTGKTSFDFTIAKKKVEKPLALTTTFTYNGAEQTYMPTGFDENLMTIAGGTQTEAGEHTVTVELKDATNYEWADGTAQKLNFSFNIGALPDNPVPENNGGLAWWAILLIVIAALVFIFAVIVFITVRRKKDDADDDGFNDYVTEEDLK